MSDTVATPDVPMLVRRVRGLLAQGRVASARPLLDAVLRIAPPDAELWELEARLALREGNVPAALAILDRGLAAFPDDVPLLLCRGGARAQADDMEGAARDAADAVIAAPDNPQAKALLGAVLLELRRPEDALACLTEALAGRPADAATRQALARAQEVLGRTEAAAATLADGVALLPSHAGLRTAAVLLQVRRGAFAEAVRLAEAARQDGCADACTLGLLGHALSSLGRHAEAAQAYAAALRLSPEDQYVRHLVAAAGLVADAGRAAPDYVRVVFDGYAPRFDAHLIGLGYRVPGLIRAELAGAGGGPVLDLGCGTGLVAVALSDCPLGPWVGVDLSPRMLEAAGARGLYAELHEADLPAFLAGEARRFPLVLAADVLPYFGDLAPLFAAVARVLAPEGRLVVSVERLPAAEGAGWRLGPLGRYRHDEAHLRAAAAAAGLRVAMLREEVIRAEAGAPVPGLFAVLAGPAA